MTRRLTTRWMLALALLALGACDSPTDLPTAISVAPVTLEAVGDAAQLVAGGAAGALPYWESLDPTIVTVTPAGMAVAVRSGSATVRARLGSRTADGTVTVLPPVNVQLSDVAIVTDDQGQTGLSMQVTNEGGRGFYRIEQWKRRADGETEHRRTYYNWNDNEAGVGVSYGVTYWDLPEIPDWVVVYSREPLSLGYEMTACVRLDGGAPCPMP